MENYKILEVGDVVYEYGNYGIYNKHTVIRVTPKQAIISTFPEIKIGKESHNGMYFRVSGGNGLSHYRIENTELIKQWFIKKSIERLKEYRWGNLPYETLVEIIKLLPCE